MELWPASVRKASTLHQFARLLSLVDPEDLPGESVAECLRAAIPLAAAARGRRPASPELDEVVDPYRRGDQAYGAAFTEIKASVDLIVGRVAPPVGG